MNGIRCPQPAGPPLALLGALLLLGAGSAPAAGSATLAWDPSPDTNVVGYALYCGPVGQGYTTRLEVQNRTTQTVTNLTEGLNHSFVVTAYTVEGVESLPSNEVTYLVPGALRVAPSPGQGLGMVGFQGQAGETVTVQASADLVRWQTLYELQSPTAQTFQIVDPASAALPQRFYRLEGTNVATRKLQFSRLAGAALPKLSFVGGAGQVVQVQASDDRVHWTTLYQVPVTTNQWIDFIDPATTPVPMRFYRLATVGLPSTDVTYLGPGALRCGQVTGRNLALLGFPAQAGETVSVQASEDLVSWQTLYELHPTTNQVIQMVDPASSNLARRFYRLLGTNVAQRKLQFSRLSAPRLAKLRFVAPPGDVVQVQASADLQNWITLHQLKSTTNQWIELIDPDSAWMPRRFYRLARAPDPQ